MDMDKIEMGMKVKAQCRCHPGHIGEVVGIYNAHNLAEILLGGDRICLPSSLIEPA